MPNRIMNVARKAAKSLSAKRINENTKRRNKRFEKLDRMGKRVQIAKDVLALLDMEKLFARRGIYISTPYYEKLNDLLEENPDVNCAVQFEAVESCNVCALGAVFLGAVRRGAVECEQFDILSSDDDAMREMLAPYFSEDELWDMENYFESGSGYSMGDDARLREVMNTIIQSNGQKVRPDVDDADSDYY